MITVGAGGDTALVLADEPAKTCFFPEELLFVRWLAADSEAELFEAAEAVLSDPDTAWEDGGLWVTDGPAVLMDSRTGLLGQVTLHSLLKEPLRRRIAEPPRRRVSRRSSRECPVGSPPDSLHCHANRRRLRPRLRGDRAEKLDGQS
ncbi:Imm21 family immunity protein [Streptomyces sp. NPDC048208]|uniref:Imm21 family immunity protein n=1 Tax=Streptomyces sp. NPDC048208 TaxID=3365515 RepID=UPI0037220946